MAHSLQARKRVKQAEKHRQQNASQKSEMRTYIKRTRSAILAGSIEDAQASYRQATSKMDRLARKKLIHPNTAARYKSRLAKHIKALVGS